MNKHKLNKLHVSELANLIYQGDEFALDVLIDKQQSGQCLRYYPEPRSDPLDDGLVGLSIKHVDGCIEIRSGRPLYCIVIDEEIGVAWLTNIAASVTAAAHYHLSKGKKESQLRAAIDAKATVGFDADIVRVADASVLEIDFQPEGLDRWILSVSNCAKIVSELYDAAHQDDWDLDSISPHEIEKIEALAGLHSQS